MRQIATTILVVAILLTGCAPTDTPTPSDAATVSPRAPPPATPATPATPIVPTSTAPRPTPSHSTETPSVEALPPATGDWQPVPAQDAVARTQFQSVVWTGTRFVATGIALDGQGDFLDSRDGMTWHRQGPAANDAFPSGIAAGPLGVVAVGTIGMRPASWASRDGTAWTPARDAFPSSAARGDTVSVSDVVASGQGWLAVGREDPPCNFDCGLAPVRALAWTSVDGLHWTPVAKQRSLLRSGMNGVAAGGPGFVAAGTASGRAVLWTSIDGRVWSRVPDAPMFRPRRGASGAWITGVGVSTGHGVIVVVGWAFGVGPGGEPAVVAWWSRDARTWRRARVARAAGGQVFSVASTPNGFLATGPSGGTSCLGGIWSSSDGATWTCVASDPAFTGFGPYAAAGSPSIEIAVGLTSADDDAPDGLPGAAWWRTTP